MSDARTGWRGSRLLRYAGEFAVVFLGVTLSFVAENYREAQAERRLEGESIERLRRDFVQDLSDFPGNLERAEAGLAAIDWLLGVRGAAAPSTDSVAHYLGQFLLCSGMMANTSEYESLKASGGLNRIQNEEFRQQLTLNYERYPQLAALHDLDCQKTWEIIRLVSAEVHLVPSGYETDVTVTGSAAGVIEDREFQAALVGQRFRRLGLRSLIRQRLAQLERLSETADSFLAGG